MWGLTTYNTIGGDNMHHILDKCPFCGARRQLSHTKYTDRCEECGLRYCRYMSAKSRNSTKVLEKVIAEYKELDEQGYKVPRALKGVSSI